MNIKVGFCIAIQAGLLLGQNTNGTVTGIVTDSSEAVVTGAKITGTNRETGFRTQTQTSTAGVYALSLLPGVYDLVVESAGFKTAVRESLEVNVNQTSRLDVVLEVGSLSERV